MKKINLLSAAFALYALSATAADNLTVEQTSGSSTAFPIDKIGKITFSETGMQITDKNDSQIGSFNFSDISRLLFDGNGSVAEINPDNTLKFVKNGNTISINGLSVATDCYIVDMAGHIQRILKDWDGSPTDVSTLTEGVYAAIVGNAAFKFIK